MANSDGGILVEKKWVLKNCIKTPSITNTVPKIKSIIEEIFSILFSLTIIFFMINRKTLHYSTVTESFR